MLAESQEILPAMTTDEAQSCVAAIREGVENVRTLVLHLHDRGGWKSLGYASWVDCVTAEFGTGRSHVYRQLQAALISKDLSPRGDKQTLIPEKHLRPLAKLHSPEERREAWAEAKATAPEGNVTAGHVEKVVRKKKGLPEAEPRPAGRSKVNGVVVADPPDVAKARAAGHIAPDVVVEVLEPEPVPAQEHVSEPAPEAGQDDAEWLAGLPARGGLPAGLRGRFDADAMDYRRLEPHRKTLQHHAARLVKGAGEYAYRVTRFLRTDHPKHWVACPATEHGGCGGTGEVPLVGQCPKCRGRGYWVH